VAGAIGPDGGCARDEDTVLEGYCTREADFFFKRGGGGDAQQVVIWGSGHCVAFFACEFL